MDKPKKNHFTSVDWVTQLGGLHFGGRALAPLIEAMRHAYFLKMFWLLRLSGKVQRVSSVDSPDATEPAR
jgi:hypothetical protein